MHCDLTSKHSSSSISYVFPYIENTPHDQSCARIQSSCEARTHCITLCNFLLVIRVQVNLINGRRRNLEMTKDWDAVQDEIRELSFSQKKPLEEVKALMERKHKFRASSVAPC